jgi:hypothetical protein
MKKITLYSTLGCHLCEQALGIIQPLLEGGQGSEYVLEEVDIADSDLLVELYGIRIPVVKRSDSQTELGWPFDSRQFVEFLS